MWTHGYHHAVPDEPTPGEPTPMPKPVPFGGTSGEPTPMPKPLAGTPPTPEAPPKPDPLAGEPMPSEAPPGPAAPPSRAAPPPTAPLYKGEPLDSERGPGLGCFWVQVIILGALLIITPLTVALSFPEWVSAALLILTLILLLFAGQTVIFLLRLVAADRRTRRTPQSATARKTVGMLEDEAARADRADLARSASSRRAARPRDLGTRRQHRRHRHETWPPTRQGPGEEPGPKAKEDARMLYGASRCQLGVADLT